jgi:hypothetical protein
MSIPSIPPAGSHSGQPAAPARQATRFTFNEIPPVAERVRRASEEHYSPMAVDSPHASPPQTPVKATATRVAPGAPHKAPNPNPHPHVPCAARRVL